MELLPIVFLLNTHQMSFKVHLLFFSILLITCFATFNQVRIAMKGSLSGLASKRLSSRLNSSKVSQVCHFLLSTIIFLDFNWPNLHKWFSLHVLLFATFVWYFKVEQSLCFIGVKNHECLLIIRRYQGSYSPQYGRDFYYQAFKEWQV